jgi:hypothetical protein
MMSDNRRTIHQIPAKKSPLADTKKLFYCGNLSFNAVSWCVFHFQLSSLVFVSKTGACLIKTFLLWQSIVQCCKLLRFTLPTLHLK